MPGAVHLKCLSAGSGIIVDGCAGAAAPPRPPPGPPRPPTRALASNALRFRRQRNGQRLARDNAVARFAGTAVKSHFPSRAARSCPFELAVRRQRQNLIGRRGQRSHRRSSATRARCRASGAASRSGSRRRSPGFGCRRNRCCRSRRRRFRHPRCFNRCHHRRSRIGKNSQGVNRQRNVQRLAAGDGVARVGHDALHSQLRIFLADHAAGEIRRDSRRRRQSTFSCRAF